jgi:hypothetical protein
LAAPAALGPDSSHERNGDGACAPSADDYRWSLHEWLHGYVSGSGASAVALAARAAVKSQRRCKPPASTCSLKRLRACFGNPSSVGAARRSPTSSHGGATGPSPQRTPPNRRQGCLFKAFQYIGGQQRWRLSLLSRAGSHLSWPYPSCLPIVAAQQRGGHGCPPEIARAAAQRPRPALLAPFGWSSPQVSLKRGLPLTRIVFFQHCCLACRAVAGDAVMSRATYFVQECPTCGRYLQVRIEYLGRTVVCQHCRGPFEARDPSSQVRSSCVSGPELLERADQLLASAAERRTRPR